ncbi:diguanylate cyclase [Ureibacillus chungkukjangi]|uniref:diguanylate cyclase domain-containing protein n=1 Tax=Ureibacillus chungkukjangi TaxID=1202712 RepID=UPI00203D4A38|nr:diguanylate cyclase [Ureibacillus chungkukjangi]MCM3387148.1 diguanylate cyclase [Ureibacillus chungkukjangi]
MKNTHHTLGQRLLFRTGLTAILFIILILLSLFYLVKEVDKHGARQKELIEIDENLTALYIAVIDQETGQRGYNLTGNIEFLQPFYNGIKVFKTKKADLQKQINKYPSFNLYVLDTIKNGEIWTNQFGIPHVQSSKVNEHLTEQELKIGKTAFDSFRLSYTAAHNHVETESKHIQEVFIHKVIVFIIGSSLLTILTIGVLWSTLFKKFNSITRPIVELSECVKDYSNNIFIKEPPKYIKNDEIADLISNVNSMRMQLEVNRMYMDNLANKDGLTGLYNRRYFNQKFEEEWKRQLNARNNINLIIFDIDYFKRYNDLYGHVLGDECLILISKTVLDLFENPAELPARYGGEEFVIITLEQDIAKIIAKAKVLRRAVENLNIDHSGSEISDFVTISIGVSSVIPNNNMEPKCFIDQADKALYNSKVNGKNKVSSIQL